jgi:hypothetical protein
MKINISVQKKSIKLSFEDLPVSTLNKLGSFISSTDNITIGITDDAVILLNLDKILSLKNSFPDTKYDFIYISKLGLFVLNLREFEKDKFEEEGSDIIEIEQGDDHE